MKLVKNDSYLLFINEEADIKEGNIAIHDFGMGYDLEIPCDKDNLNSNTRKLVVAYYPLSKEAKDLDLPLLPSPFEEVDIETVAWDKAKVIFLNKIGREAILEKNNDLLVISSLQEGFIEGYKTATKQFSLEDMYRVAIKVANKVSRPEYGEIININEIVDTYIQSLRTQQLPKEFIPNIFYRTSGAGRIIGQKEYNGFSEQMKLQCKLYFESNNNSEGKEELVGTYKY